MREDFQEYIHGMSSGIFGCTGIQEIHNDQLSFSILTNPHSEEIEHGVTCIKTGKSSLDLFSSRHVIP